MSRLLHNNACPSILGGPLPIPNSHVQIHAAGARAQAEKLARRLQAQTLGTVRWEEMVILVAPNNDHSPGLMAGAIAPARRRRPRGWLLALAFASFLAPCHSPIVDAASGAYPFFCTLFPWVAP